MKPAAFQYVRAGSIREAVAALAEHGDEAKVLAGGQSLVPMLNMRLASPSALVDVNPIRALDYVTVLDGSVRVGALVRQASPELAQVPFLAECLPYVGHFVTRNRGTVGGSIAHADAKAELPLALVALGGSAIIEGLRGLRRIGAEELFVTHYTTSIAPDELLVETVWPAIGPGGGHAFEEFALRAGDYALAMAACVLRIEDGRVAECRVAVGGPTERPILSRAGPLIAGQAVTEETARAAAETARAEVEPVDSVHASAAYQRHLVGLLVERAVLRAWSNAAGSTT